MNNNDKGTQAVLKGKLRITGELKVLTGMHIGAGGDFAPIGAVDSPFIRDVLTHAPIIPGASLKGKMRTLLAKNKCSGYVMNGLDDDDIVIKRLFGSSKPVIFSRLQFFDLFINSESEKNFSALETDTYIGEVKFENTISRFTGVANPRQIERVPAGVVFDFNLVYNVENEEEVKTDFEALKTGLNLIQNDYLGGHGSRGYGRVKFLNLKVEKIGDCDVDVTTLEKSLN
ncbi:MAG: type III-A CRISPR-associated RAMP protein Csm3 [Phascolarctobacterium sp.]|nr:type III-A CRISPR-associated RAMP protein Csm3 [Candidatus Phascolarctobacterium caballi]